MRAAGASGLGFRLRHCCFCWASRCVLLPCQPASVPGAFGPWYPLPPVQDAPGPAGPYDTGRPSAGPVSGRSRQGTCGHLWGQQQLRRESELGAHWFEGRNDGPGAVTLRQPGNLCGNVPSPPLTPHHPQGEHPTLHPGPTPPLPRPPAEELRRLRHAGPAPGEQPQGVWMGMGRGGPRSPDGAQRGPGTVPRPPSEAELEEDEHPDLWSPGQATSITCALLVRGCGAPHPRPASRRVCHLLV